MALESTALDGSEESVNTIIAYKDITTLIEAIQRENMVTRHDDDISHNSVVLSSWTIRMLDLGYVKYKIRNKRTYSCAVMGLGGSLTLEKYSKKATEIKEIRNELLEDDNDLIGELVSSATDGVTVDILKNTKGRHVDFSKSLYNSFADFVDDSALTYSSVYRCAIYLAFETVIVDFSQSFANNIADNIALYDVYFDVRLDQYKRLQKGDKK